MTDLTGGYGNESASQGMQMVCGMPDEAILREKRDADKKIN